MTHKAKTVTVLPFKKNFADPCFRLLSMGHKLYKNINYANIISDCARTKTGQIYFVE